MPKHGITHADEIFHGNSNYAPGISRWGRDGQEITAPFMWDWDDVAPRTITAASIATSVGSIAANTTLNINGSLSSSLTTSQNTTAVFDVAKCVRLTMAGSIGSNVTFVLVGSDDYNAIVREEVAAGAGAGLTVDTNKAFKKVHAWWAKAAYGRLVTLGDSNKLGIPFALGDLGAALKLSTNMGTNILDTSSVVVADATTATATTGDTRGTVAPVTAANGTLKFRFWFTAKGKDTKNNLYGVDQYAG